jgi:serine protease Do
MLKNRILPALIIGLAGAVIGSFVMLLYASTHLPNVAGPNNAPPPVSAAPLTGVSDQDRIVSAVKRTKASVVAIDVEINGQQYLSNPFAQDPFFRQFFGNQNPNIVQPYSGEASGSGFVYDRSGDIVTNAHVITPPQGGHITKLTVVFSNGDKVPAHVVAANIGSDIAIIRVDGYAKLPPPLRLADSDRLEQGQWAIAIGEPLELQDSVTVGVVSAFDRNEEVQTEDGSVISFKGLLQTSAPINRGNSGGPLIDIDGQVIGINQSTAPSALAQGIGFAIPSNTVRRVVAQLELHPGIHQGTGEGYVGVMLENLNAGLRNQIGYNGDGVAVIQVVGGSPADQAGLQPGDVIISADGRTFTSNGALSHYIASKRPGDAVRLNVWSQGDKKLVVVKLGERPAAQPEQQQP